MVLTKAQQSALTGMILGDGYLQPTGKRNARLRLEHSQKQEEYLKWKINLIPQLFESAKIKRIKRVNPKTKKEYSYIRIQSHSSSYLGKLRKIFYRQGKKVIPENLKRYLRYPLGLAVWFLDDGYFCKRSKDKGVYIYLGKASKRSAEIALKVLKERFILRGKILDKKSKGLVLYFPFKEGEKFIKLVENFIPDCMRYKISSKTP